MHMVNSSCNCNMLYFNNSRKYKKSSSTRTFEHCFFMIFNFLSFRKQYNGIYNVNGMRRTNKEMLKITIIYFRDISLIVITFKYIVKIIILNNVSLSRVYYALYFFRKWHSFGRKK